MRITFLTHTPGRGGSTALLAQLAGYFRGEGHQVSVVVGDDCENPMLEDYIVVPTPSGSRWRARMESYCDAIEKTSPDLVYSISGKDELDVHRFLRYPRVRHVSSTEQHEYANIPFWIQQTDGFCEGITTNTPDVLDALLPLLQHPCVGAVAPYRISRRYLDIDANSTLTVDTGKPVEVCFVGRLESFQKQVRWFPEIIARCKRMGRQLTWHIYGDGPEREWLGIALRKAGCDRDVVFHGWLDSESLAQGLPRHDIFFLASRWEGLPIAMVEAMLCGLAPVAPAIRAGITYIMEFGGGWTYERPSPATAAEALVQATSDRQELSRRKARAREVARTLFNERVVSEQLGTLSRKLETLRFNGRCLSIESSRPIRDVPFDVLFRRKLSRAMGLILGKKRR